MPPDVDVIVPVHNRWDLTRNCLEHLRSQTLPHNVFLVDNGSSDGTPRLARAMFSEVNVLELGTNRGFPEACNRGVSSGSAEVIVLLNNDVVCRPDFLQKLVAPVAAAAGR